MSPKGSEENVTNLSKIQFTINGKTYVVGSEEPPTLTLLQFIRQSAKLTGTKSLCYEGGCGICTVVATKYDLETNSLRTFSVKSCQTLLYSCVGWAIETIEHLGNKYDGYHSLQKAVSGFYGTQCGYCTPGFIMTMYGQLKSSGSLTTEQVEKSLDGNLCRCTGYRPILDSFKSLANDAPPELTSRLADIEESYKSRCPQSGTPCERKCSEKSCHVIINEPAMNLSVDIQEGICINFGTIQWYRPTSLEGLYSVLKKTVVTDRIRFVNGNTGQGVYKNDGPYNIYIDTNGIKELYIIYTNVPLIVGANVSLCRCIKLFHDIAKNNLGYSHLEQIAKHWELTANVAIRNVGSWAGNLMLKNGHKEFPSDIFVTLCAIDAVVKIADPETKTTSEIPVEDLGKTDIGNRFIVSMLIPLQKDVFLRSYKITQRAVNSHAYINAAFKFKVDRNDNFRLSRKPDIFYGGVRPDFIRATETELFLVNKQLGLTPVIKAAMKRLYVELQPDKMPTDASPAYRTSLCQSLLYKAILDLVGSSADPEYRSGGFILLRPLSSGKQTFDANQESWPIGKAIPKLESDYQVSGEAAYLDDMTCFPDELHGAFVQTTVAKATIDTIDVNDALKIPGVVDFITSTDIIGYNSVMNRIGNQPDPVFTFPTVSYAGQSVGLIVAKRRDIALRAVKLVKLTYKNIHIPTLTIRDALKQESMRSPEKKEKSDIIINNLEDGTTKLLALNVIKGDLDMGSQFHLTMEPYSALVVPIEDGYDVYSTTQWQNNTKSVLSQVLGIEAHRINMETRRIGGGYGGKISRANIVVCAAAVASQKLRVPVRVVLPLDVNMTMTGWREPYYSSYEVGFDNDGRFQYVNVQFVGDSGFVSNESSASYAVSKIPSVYYADKWSLSPKVVITDTAANTWCRTPGSIEAIATIENIIEHVSSYLKKDPSYIREINFVTGTKQNKGGVGPRGENLAATKIFPKLKEQSMYDIRRVEIEVFNKEHRWKKRGLGIIPMLYKYDYPPFRYTVYVAIYDHDGSVAISHGGIEMGQGVNTKVAQVAAKVLGIDLEYIVIKPTNTLISANSSVTGGSFTSDLCAHGVAKACEHLKARIDVVRAQMKEKNKKEPDWPVLIKECSKHDVDLSERYWTAIKEHPKGYDIYGGAVVEVEIDVLTGQYIIHRTDIIEDCGKSISPYIDVGQVEGSIIMGFGFYTSEIVKYNAKTGEKVTNGTWEYKVPTALDIPVDFRISFLEGGNNPYGVVGSKATGEPAVCLSYCIISALRDAIKSARADAGDSKWFDMHVPMTVEKIQRLCKVNPEQFVLKKNPTEAEVAFKDDFVISENENTKSDEGTCSVN